MSQYAVSLAGVAKLYDRYIMAPIIHKLVDEDASSKGVQNEETEAYRISRYTMYAYAFNTATLMIVSQLVLGLFRGNWGNRLITITTCLLFREIAKENLNIQNFKEVLNRLQSMFRESWDPNYLELHWNRWTVVLIKNSALGIEHDFWSLCKSLKVCN